MITYMTSTCEFAGGCANEAHTDLIYTVPGNEHNDRYAICVGCVEKLDLAALNNGEAYGTWSLPEPSALTIAKAYVWLVHRNTTDEYNAVAEVLADHDGEVWYEVGATGHALAGINLNNGDEPLDEEIVNSAHRLALTILRLDPEVLGYCDICGRPFNTTAGPRCHDCKLVHGLANPKNPHLLKVEAPTSRQQADDRNYGWESEA